MPAEFIQHEFYTCGSSGAGRVLGREVERALKCRKAQRPTESVTQVNISCSRPKQHAPRGRWGVAVRRVALYNAGA